MSKPPLSYAAAGVDLARADRFAAQVRALAERTHGPEVIPSGEAYAGLFRPPLAGLRSPLLAATCDGVGTKLLVARDCHSYRGLGQDLVAMNVNDLLPRGARPLFFLDYLAAGKLDRGPLLEIASGMASACAEVGCALLGGETAEMPDVYAENEYDLAGFAVGLVDEAQVPAGDVAVGDVVLGLPSNGVHANGFSLIRKVIAQAGYGYADVPPELGHSLGAELLRPTALYVREVLDLLARVRIKSAAHITGGGLLHRLAKLAGQTARIVIDPASYVRPPIFDVIARWGGLPESELAATFNMGLGFVAIVSPSDAEAGLASSSSAWRIVGRVVAGPAGVELGYARS